MATKKTWKVQYSLLKICVALDEWPKEVFSTSLVVRTSILKWAPDKLSWFTKRILMLFPRVLGPLLRPVYYDSFFGTDKNWCTSVAQSFQHPITRLQRFADNWHGVQHKLKKAIPVMRLSTQTSSAIWLCTSVAISGLSVFHQRCKMFFVNELEKSTEINPKNLR